MIIVQFLNILSLIAHVIFLHNSCEVDPSDKNKRLKKIFLDPLDFIELLWIKRSMASFQILFDSIFDSLFNSFDHVINLKVRNSAYSDGKNFSIIIDNIELILILLLDDKFFDTWEKFTDVRRESFKIFALFMYPYYLLIW